MEQNSEGSFSELAEGNEAGEGVVVISKTEFLNTLQEIRNILMEYGLVMDNMTDTEEWNQEALSLVKSHQALCDNAQSPLAKIDLVIGLFQYLLSRINQDQFAFRIPGQRGIIPEEEIQHLAEFSQHLKDLKGPIENLVAEITQLAHSVPLESRDKAHSLLVAIASMFKAIIRQDWEDVTLIMTHINLITTAQDSGQLVKHVAKIARNIYNSLNEFSQDFTVENLGHSTVEIPDAVIKLRSVIDKLEEAANTNLDSLEQLNLHLNETLAWLKESNAFIADCDTRLEEMKGENQALAPQLEPIQECLRNEVGRWLTDMDKRGLDNGQTFLSLIANQSFQDLTGQTLKKVITFIEDLQFKLVELLPKTVLHQSPDSDPHQEEGEIQEMSNKPYQSQEDVDQLLADIGF